VSNAGFAEDANDMFRKTGRKIGKLPASIAKVPCGRLEVLRLERCLTTIGKFIRARKCLHWILGLESLIALGLEFLLECSDFA
jgi:hypothetical protein